MTPQQDGHSNNVVKFIRQVNGINIEQRVTDGFINGTAMCVAHGKKMDSWFRTQDTLDLFCALAEDLGLPINYSELSNLDVSRLSASKYKKLFPELMFTKAGSPENGGGTWLHPDLASYLAQQCNKPFAIQVSRWIREWMTTSRNPIKDDLDKEFMLWQQRYDIRIYLKDYLRPELMCSVIRWAEQHGKSPITFCAKVHDLMNERIQGFKAKQLRLMNGLPLGALMRDYFGASPLVCYSAINKLARNAIDDRSLEPLQAVHEACDHFLGKAYEPKPVQILENLYSQEIRLKEAKKRKQISQKFVQLNLPFIDGDDKAV
jgi:hypothetical protein